MSLRTLAAAAAACLALSFPSAHAAVATPGPALRIADSVIVNFGGRWNYDYTLTNNTQCFVNCSGTVLGKSVSGYVLAVREFALPYFDDAGITTILSPNGWLSRIDPADRFGLGFGARTLIWSAQTDSAGIALGASLGGFNYGADFAAGKGPFSAALGNLQSLIGDPAIPLSPNAVSADITPLNPVPEPPIHVLLLIGLAAMAATLRSRGKTSRM